MKILVNLGTKFIVVFLGIILGLILCEIFLRFDKRYSFENLVHIVHIFDNQIPIYKKSKLFGYELIPNLKVENGDPVNTNSFGMADKEYTLKKPKNVFRILVLGDSITHWGKWSEYLEDKLNRIGNYEVLNAGVSGWGLYQYWMYLKYKGIKFEPDIVIIGFCLNDMRCATYCETILVDKIEGKLTYFIINEKSTIESINKTLFIDPYWYKTSYLYRFIVRNLFFVNNKKFPFSGNIEEEKVRIKMLLDMKFITRGKILGIIFSYLKPVNEYDEFEKYEYDLTLSSLKKVGIEYLDLTPYFNKYGKKIIKFRNKEDDKIHFNEEANKIKAEIIYDWLVPKIKEYNKLLK